MFSPEEMLVSSIVQTEQVIYERPEFEREQGGVYERAQRMEREGEKCNYIIISKTETRNDMRKTAAKLTTAYSRVNSTSPPVSKT